MSAPARFECREVRAGYGPVTIVPTFDVVADAGTVLAVLGPNGAGKTTVLTTLAGLLPRQAGSVSVDGQGLPSGRPTAASRAGVVLVPDDRSLFTTLSVVENLLAARGRHATTVDDVLDAFPLLAARRTLAAGDLSGGEQQMLALARALIQEPRVLLVDEMSMGLAPVVVEQLLPTVRRIADERDAVVVLVEQHVSLALEVADHVTVLVHGDQCLDRPAAEVRADPVVLEAAYLGRPVSS